ncbi:MAG: histidine phosphatase family protein [Woeseia sp.]|nr:histidine phosphatase family protein [Woeseia sp.]
MKTLTLLRHAKSSWDSPALADNERPLNKRGERDAPVMAARIQAAGIRPSLIISSHAVRAWTTAKVVANELSYPLEFLQREKDLYLASRRRILEIISRQDEGFNNMMVVGHNPGLTDLANYLVPDLTDNLPTCGVVSVSVDSETWELRNDATCELLLYDYPKKPQ